MSGIRNTGATDNTAMCSGATGTSDSVVRRRIRRGERRPQVAEKRDDPREIVERAALVRAARDREARDDAEEETRMPVPIASQR